ncbi:tRNA-binding protein [Janibacter melonis]|uniref:tRNA-binding protein n=1 Tax=Janibacter melonis TaxID=262209 RepID=UPI0020945C48|nr:tRNA-binding protein [Janibacter melonis]
MGEPQDAQTTEPLDWATFERVDLRVGTITAAEPNARARKSAYVLQIDLGPLGTKTSSAQITDLYEPADLVGRQVLCVVNFPPKRIAGVVSEVLVTGAPDDEGRIVLATTAGTVPDGSRLV